MPSPFRTSPQLGPNLWQVVPSDGVWYDDDGVTMSPKLLTPEFGDDGHTYVLVRASAAIAAAASPGTQVTITEPAGTAAAGAGGYYAPNSTVLPGGVPINAYFWARRGAPGAP